MGTNQLSGQPDKNAKREGGEGCKPATDLHPIQEDSSCFMSRKPGYAVDGVGQLLCAKHCLFERNHVSFSYA